MAEKPHHLIKYRGFEYTQNGIAEASVFYGEFQIWKDDEKVHEGKVDEPSDRLDYAMDAAERAAIEWINSQEG